MLELMKRIVLGLLLIAVLIGVAGLWQKSRRSQTCETRTEFAWLANTKTKTLQRVAQEEQETLYCVSDNNPMSNVILVLKDASGQTLYEQPMIVQLFHHHESFSEDGTIQGEDVLAEEITIQAGLPWAQ